MTGTPHQPPKSKGLLGWLGRQVGYVKQAVQTDVEKLPKVVYRQTDVQQHPHPADPDVTLRRTTIDEVIVPAGGKSLNNTPQATSNEQRT